MKKTSKVLLLSLCAVLLVTTSVLGTMAYLTSHDQVVNTFTVGNVAIKLDEKDVDDSTPGADRDQENTYKLIPGHKYEKDPVIHVDANSEDCYLFVSVVDEIAAIEADLTVVDQMAAKGWIPINAEKNIFVYTTDKINPAVVSRGTDVQVFDNFTIAGAIDNTILANYAKKTITVSAYAIQADGFSGKTADEIWTSSFGGKD